MKNIIRIFLCLILGGATAQAQSLDSMQKATNLGTILAAEKFCALTYDQSAISEWIDTNTDPTDLSFASTLQTMIQGAEFQLTAMSPSAKTAHCRSIERTAKHYRFVNN